MPDVILWTLVVGTGACIGSFLNVCIHRLPERLSVVRPGSACPSCGRAIVWHDNIPIVSYLVLGGRCRACGAAIPWRYPAVEAATAILFGLLFHRQGPTPEFLAQAAFAAALVALIVIDARHQILPDAITLPGIAAGLLTAPLRGGWPGAREAVAAAALGYAIPWAINASYHGWQALRRVPRAEREDGIGMGDYKLLAMIGAFLGPRVLLFVLFLGAVSGAAFGIAMMRLRGYGWKSRLPLGVFLGAAALLALFVGEAWIGWYLGLLRVTP